MKIIIGETNSGKSNEARKIARDYIINDKQVMVIAVDLDKYQGHFQKRYMSNELSFRSLVNMLLLDREPTVDCFVLDVPMMELSKKELWMLEQIETYLETRIVVVLQKNKSFKRYETYSSFEKLE